MNPHSTPRHLLATLGVLLAACASSVCCASASASTFGELARFGARQEQLPSTGTPLAGGITGKAKEGPRFGEEELPGPEINYAIGVDPSEGNAVFVLDEPKEPEEKEATGERDTVTRHLRIQKFNPATKGVEAKVEFAVTSPVNEEESVEEIEYEQFSNIAVDAETGVLYVLSEEPRKWNTNKDEEAPVATTLFAFNTKELGFAPHTTEGVLASSEALKAESTVPGAALIEPRGIAVDPKTHEVIILAHEDSKGEKVDDIGKAGDHFVLQRVSDEGKLGERYVDKKNFFKASRIPDEYPTSPVVTSAGHVLMRFGTEGIAEVPSDFEAATKAETEPTALYTEPQNVVSVAESEVESEAGGALSLSPEGSLYEPASIVNEAEVLKTKDNGQNWGIAKRSTEGPLLGWSGGQSVLLSEELAASSKKPNTDECVLQPGPSKEPAMDVAAGANGDVFVLSPPFLEAEENFVTTMAVIELGPQGKGCPTAAGSAVTVSENGIALGAGEAVEVGSSVQLSTKVDQADALEAEWTFENQTTHEAPIVEKPKPLEFQTEESGLKLLLQEPVLNFKFPTAGQYLVTAKVHTDDLGSEQIEAKAATVTVEPEAGAPAAPKVTRQPANDSVTEPAKATFAAEASGSPKPKVQWQLSTEKGKWTDISGATTDTLTIEGTKTSESGHEYRAVFTNSAGEATSNAATLTVKEKETPPPPPPPSPVETPPATTPIVTVLPHTESKAPAVPDAIVASTTVTASSSGVLAIKVTCPTGETSCMGTVTLRTLTAVSARSAKAGAAKSKRAILTLTSGSFSVAGGASQTIKLHLSSTARKLLAHAHTLRVRATLVAHDSAGGQHTGVQTLTLRLAKR
jgi:Immunoglobulin I-set domain